MDVKLELVLVPVSDVDRAKAFYTDKCGFDLLVDTPVGEDIRIVQVTPPGSACSIGFGVGVQDGVAPGSYRGMRVRRGANRARRPGQRRPAHHRRRVARWPAPGAGELHVLRRVQRPGRQPLGSAGGPPRR